MAIAVPTVNAADRMKLETRLFEAFWEAGKEGVSEMLQQSGINWADQV